jgi:hypothetical protein
MEKVRENIINLLKKGAIPNYDYINYYNKAKEIKFEKDEFLQKNIDALKDYYPTANKKEKAIINNVLFILEIFNSEQNALRDFFIQNTAFKLSTNKRYLLCVKFF